MSGLSDVMPILLGQGANAPADGGQSPLAPLLMFLPIILLFYFMIILPQQRNEKKRRLMISALKKNDRVLTAAGIYGTVVSVDEAADRMVLRVADGVKLEVTRSSVARVLDEGAEKPSTEVAAKKP